MNSGNLSNIKDKSSRGGRRPILYEVFIHPEKKHIHIYLKDEQSGINFLMQLLTKLGIFDNIPSTPPKLDVIFNQPVPEEEEKDIEG